METILKSKNMKSVVLITFMLLFIQISCSADEEITVQGIIDYQKTIDLEKDSYIKMEVDLNNLSSEGGYVIGYISANRVRYMETFLYGEMGRISSKTYILQDEIFIL